MSRLNDEQFTHVLESVHDIEYGSIVITVHDGQITQIDTTEKKRFPSQRKRQLKVASEN